MIVTRWKHPIYPELVLKGTIEETRKEAEEYFLSEKINIVPTEHKISRKEYENLEEW